MRGLNVIEHIIGYVPPQVVLTFGENITYASRSPAEIM